MQLNLIQERVEGGETDSYPPCGCLHQCSLWGGLLAEECVAAAAAAAAAAAVVELLSSPLPFLMVLIPIMWTNSHPKSNNTINLQPHYAR